MNIVTRLREPAKDMLALRGAKFYDLDENPVDVKQWTKLENVSNILSFSLQGMRR